MREQSLAAYREALKTIETIRAGSLRADESRTTFLATTEDVYDEAANAFAEMALAIFEQIESPSISKVRSTLEKWKTEQA